MFWDKGYTPSQNIEALLERGDATLEEFLEDDDIIQECKTLKKSIVSYFTRPDVIRHLIELITTEPAGDLPMFLRFRHANMACEILTLGLPSLALKILTDEDTMTTLYSYLENEPPLNPLLSSFFSKTFSMLFTKKSEQDWFLYQHMCLKLLEFLKCKNNFLDLICKHFETPIIPDIIMQMMREIEGGQLKRTLFEWLTEEQLVERLIATLGNPKELEKHQNVAEFLCDLIQQGRTMRQTEEENDSFEPAFNGSNPILRSIESPVTVETLLNVILEPNAHESAIISGITVVLTLIKPVVFIDEPQSDRSKQIHNREKEIHEEILASVIRVIVPHLKDFVELLKNPPIKPGVTTTAAKLDTPFGMTRLQICRLFTVLLQTKNEEVIEGICATDFLNLFLYLFKKYCWNNFLHAEMEKCVQVIFYSQPLHSSNSNQGSTKVNDGSYSKSSNNGDGTPAFYELFKSPTKINDNNDNTNGNYNNSNLSLNYNNICGDNDDDLARLAPGAGAICAPIGVRPKPKEVNIEINVPITIEPIETIENGKDDDDNNIDKNEDIKIGGGDITKLQDFANLDISANNDDVEVFSSISIIRGNIFNLVNANENKNVAVTEGDEAELPKTESLSFNNVVGDFDKNPPLLQQNDNNAVVGSVTTSSSLLEVGKDDTDNIPSPKSQQSIDDFEDNDVNDLNPPITPLQTHAIVDCGMVSKLLECWKLNIESQAAPKPRRLGYMGHLIRIFRHIASCVTDYDNVSALIEKHFNDPAETQLWFSLMSPIDGDLHKELAIQSRFLANCNAHDPCEYQQRISKDFPEDNSTWDYIMSSNMLSTLGAFTDGSGSDIVFALDYDYRNNDNDNDIDDNMENDSQLFQFGRNTDADNDDNDTDPATTECLALFSKSLSASNTFNVTNNPWDNVDPFSDVTSNSNMPWSADFGNDNFADFETHFSTFSNDIGERLTLKPSDQNMATKGFDELTNPNLTTTAASTSAVLSKSFDNNERVDKNSEEEYDNNANVEKTILVDTIGKTNIIDDFNVYHHTLCDVGDLTKEGISVNPPFEAEGINHQQFVNIRSDSLDDVDDDEGMWTKPLGGANPLAGNNSDDNNDYDNDNGDNNGGINAAKAINIQNESAETANESLFENNLLTNGPTTNAELQQLPSSGQGEIITTDMTNITTTTSADMSSQSVITTTTITEVATSITTNSTPTTTTNVITADNNDEILPIANDLNVKSTATKTNTNSTTALTTDAADEAASASTSASISASATATASTSSNETVNASHTADSQN